MTDIVQIHPENVRLDQEVSRLEGLISELSGPEGSIADLAERTVAIEAALPNKASASSVASLTSAVDGLEAGLSEAQIEVGDARGGEETLAARLSSMASTIGGKASAAQGAKADTAVQPDVLSEAIGTRQPSSVRLSALADIPFADRVFLVGRPDGYDALEPLAVRLLIGATAPSDVKMIAHERANMFRDAATMDGPDARVIDGFAPFSGSSYKSFTSGPLTARGLARGWASAVNGISAVGAVFSRTDFAGRMVTIRWAVETTVPGQFGYAIVYFKNEADDTIATFTQDQDELNFVALSSTQRIYTLTFQSADPVAYGFYVTHDTSGTGAQATIGGLQYHASPFDALDIPADDLPEWTPDPSSDHLLGRENIREFPRLRDQILSDQANLTIHLAVGPGDSLSEYEIWLRNLTRRWKTELGNGGPGWTGVGYPENQGPSAVGGNVDEAEVAVSFTGAGWSGQWMSAVGSPDCCSASTSTAGGRITFTYTGADNITAVKLFFLGGSGVSRYRWNGGAWITLNLSGSGAQAVAITGMPAGAWTLDWEHVSGTGVYHGATFLTGLKGIVVHDLAVAVSDLYRWTGEVVSEHGGVSAPQWRSALAAAMNRLGPITTFLCPIATNDQTYSRSYASYEAGVRNWINGVARAARPGADIVWIMPPENGRDPANFPMRMERFAARAKKVIQQTRASLLDMQPLFGAVFSEYGNAGTRRTLFNSDLLHLNTAGGAVYRQAIKCALENRS